MTKEIIQTEGVEVSSENPTLISELITVKQIPIIEEKLESLRDKIILIVSDAMELPSTDENLQFIKKRRAQLRKELKAFEDKRKEIKNLVLDPYNAFEKIFKRCVSDIYKQGDEDLNAKIEKIEKERKAKKEKELREYFDEYARLLNLPDFITFELANINILFSLSDKKLRQQAKDFLDKVASDIKLIETQEHYNEILVEYKITLDVNQAILVVNNRHKLIEAEERKSVALRTKREQKAVNENKVDKVLSEDDSFSAPVASAVVETDIHECNIDEAIYELSFKVRGTKEFLKKLVKFMKEGSNGYEQI